MTRPGGNHRRVRVIEHRLILKSPHMPSQAPESKETVAPEIPIVPTSIGASADAFYRSGMNALLNRNLTGTKAALFPNMHIQLPVRVIYINGIKNLRAYADSQRGTVAQKLEETGLQHENAKRTASIGLAITPGIMMTPMSSILEAANAGHMNPESMSIRWMRGLMPRMVREVIFATGMNQLADQVAETVGHQFALNDPVAKGVAGSILAGVLSGYASHVPHNLSTLKLLRPKESYSTLFSQLRQTTLEARLGAESAKQASPLVRSILGTAMVFLTPKGVVIRTAQIVGSFVIINVAITALKDKPWAATSYWTAQYAPQPLPSTGKKAKAH